MLIDFVSHLMEFQEASSYEFCIQRLDQETPFSQKGQRIILVRSIGMPADKDIIKNGFDISLFTPCNPSLAVLEEAYLSSLSLLNYLRMNHNRETIHNIVVNGSVSGPYLDHTQRRYYTLSATASQTLMNT